MSSMPLYVSGFGSYVPEHRMTNHELEKSIDTNHEWIVSRTGIEERRVLGADQAASDLAVEASAQALSLAGLQPSDITHTLLATCTPDNLCPGEACTVARKLGLTPRMAFDISAACSGFIYGLQIGHGMLMAEPDGRLLLISVEGLSRRLNWEDRSTCVLFGDGAGASVLSTTPLEGAAMSAKVLSISYATDCRHDNLIMVGGGTQHSYTLGEPVRADYFVSMQGREVFKYAVRSMVSISRTVLEQAGMGIDDVDIFVPHQANLRIIEAVGERLGIENERVFINVHKYGNTSAASIPLALSEAVNIGRIQPGMKVLLSTFGAGLTWGGAVLQF